MHGFIDLYFNEVIPLKYYGAHSFNSGLAAVENIERKWGFIDNKGNQVIPFKYDGVGDFIDGLAFVEMGNYRESHYGFINKNGEEVVPLIYVEVKPFSEGLAVVMKRVDGDLKYGYINIKGDLVIPLQFNKAESFSEGLAAVSSHYSTYYYIDKNGKRFTPDLKCYWCGSFEDGFATIVVGYGDDLEYGIIDRDGKVILEPIYRTITKGGKDCFIVYRIDYKTPFSGYNLYDKRGNKLTLDDYDEIFPFIEGFAIVCNRKQIQTDNEYNFQSLYGFIDKRGKEITSCIYEDIKEFRDGVAAVKLNGKWGFINNTGRLISGIKYDDICLYNNEGDIYSLTHYDKILPITRTIPKKLKYFQENIGFVVNNNKYGIIDKNGVEIAPCIFDFFRLSDRLKSNELFIYKRNGKYGFINIKGVEICGPIYWEAFNFSDGLAACCKEGKWGFINERGDVVIPFEYFSVDSFNFGLAAFKIDNLWGYINKSNKVVIKCKYNCIYKNFEMVDGVKEPVAVVGTMTNKYSDRNTKLLINQKGKIIDDDF